MQGWRSGFTVVLASLVAFGRVVAAHPVPLPANTVHLERLDDAALQWDYYDTPERLESENSPPREYFSVNALHLDEHTVVHVGHDILNQTYVILPSPNIVSKEAVGDDRLRLQVRLYYPAAEALIAQKYSVLASQVQYLHIHSFEVVAQDGQPVYHITIPEGVEYMPPQNIEISVPQAGIDSLTFIYSFVGRSSWSQGGISADMRGIWRKLRNLEVKSDGHLTIDIDAATGVKAFDVLTLTEDAELADILEELHAVVLWGDMPGREQVLQRLTSLDYSERVHLDLQKGADELSRYPQIFGVPPDPRWVSVIHQLRAKSETTEEHKSETSASLGVEGIFNVSGSHNRSTKIHRLFEFELQGDLYIPKSMNFTVRQKEAVTHARGLLMQAHAQLKEVVYRFGIGVALNDARPSSPDTMVANHPNVTRDYVNMWHEPVDFVCPESSVLTGMQSVHLDGIEDRRFAFACGNVLSTTVQSGPNGTMKRDACRRWGPHNEFDMPVDFSCPGNTFMTGEHSTYSGAARDRVYAHTCCALVDSWSRALTRDACVWSPEVNAFDAPVTFNCPLGTVLTGVRSRHDNSPEDRVFSFECCRPRL